MMESTTYKTLYFFLGLTFFLLTACGGGGSDDTPPTPQWPQPVTFTDFTGTQNNFIIGISINAQTECQNCITVRGVVRSNIEMGMLLPDFKTFSAWPPLYNEKLFSELPIDYNSKIAVVLEDKGSGARYQYTMQKVEESADAVTISVLKCMVSDPYQNGHTIRFGLLLPKTTKPIQVLTVQSGKPTLPEYQPNGLGAC